MTTRDEYLSEFSEFYHFEDDGQVSYIWALNPTHTIIQLQGGKEAFAAAAAVANDALLADVEREYDYVKNYMLGDRFCIEIRTNNFIPQLYDTIKAIDGVEKINYVVYDTAYCRMLTDSESMAKAIKQANKLDVDIEVDDNPDMFPDE
ncbi:MAG: hypothetical protein K2N16_06525, partial [Muribaculaceae bacterium]|nr:hypothetical protein [Muribaculaceae bacterium]